MARSISFGRNGETEWRRLEVSMQMEARGACTLLVSDNRECLEEALRRLKSLAPSVTSIIPDESVVLRITEIEHQSGVSEPPIPAAWIQADIEDDTDLDNAWREALCALNQRRDHLHSSGPVFMILAGPKKLRDIVSGRAPDLFNVLTPALIDLGDETEMLVEVKEPLCWLHLSDLHIEKRWQQDVVLNGLIRDLPKLIDKADCKPDLVFVTGDIARYGKSDEYNVARGFFETLMEKLGLDPTKRLFIVPGNHDVDQSLVSRMLRRDQESIRAEQGDKFRDEVGEILGSSNELSAYSERLAAFSDFTTKLLGPARGMSLDRIWRTDVFDHGNLKVGIASLCSAWMCRPQEDKYGEIILGERQAREALDELSDAHLRIALMHHPLSWLHLEEQTAVAGLLRKHTDLVLHGHVHQTSAEKRQTSKNECIYLEAGAVYAGSSWPYGFQLGALNPTQGLLNCHFHTWSSNDGGFWHLNTGVSEDAPEGRATFSLSLDTVAESGAATGLDGLAARIKKAAAKVLSTGRGFIGIPAEISASGSKGSLMDLFVPLDFELRELRGIADEEKKIPLTNVEARLYAPNSQSRPAPRYVVLGGPGSGKSTLVLYLAVAAASREKRQVPIRMVLREYLRQGATQSLLAFAAKEISDLFAVTTRESDLQTLCDTGRALLLIDGLDEVSNPSERERIRQMITGLADRYPFSPILATSRITGYDETPLDERVFNHLVLSPFDDDQLATFISNWYDAAEPGNVRDRERKKADLEAALVAEPRAKELARNPLFATLIALVHRFEAHLPGERAKLYELCVRMLLETWPRTTGRRFQYLDEGRQRAVLEQIALLMQKERADQYDGNVTIDQKGRLAIYRSKISTDRDDLEHRIVALFNELEIAGTSRSEKERVAHLWVDWIQAGTGILVEQQPGVFKFIHLSIMEFLAGLSLLDELITDGVEAVAEFVLNNYQMIVWRETILLMLGSQATQIKLINTVVERLLQKARQEDSIHESSLLWGFLLEVLREEVDICEAHKNEMLDGLIATAPSHSSKYWHFDREIIEMLFRFSKRHQKWLFNRLKEYLVTADGDQLLGAAILTPMQMNPEQILESREDLNKHLPILLDLWPGEKKGRFAADRVDRNGALLWARTTALDVTVARGIAALTTDSRIVSACFAALYTQRTAYLADLTRQSAQKNRACDLGMEKPGIPAMIKWSTAKDEWVIRYAPALILDTPAPQPKLQMRDFARELAFDSIPKFDIDFAPNVDRWFDLFLGPNSLLDSTLSAVPSFNRDTVREFALNFANQSLLGFNSHVDRELVHNIEEHFTCNAISCDAVLPDLVSPWTTFQRVPFAEAITPMYGKRLLEIHAGLAIAAAAGMSHDERRVIAACLGQNDWICLYFDMLVKIHLRDIATIPEHHALLLAMGLASYQTLWMWPWGDEWKRLAEGAVPKHYLPAHFWHLCAAARDPEHQDEHLAEAEACLNLSDWPELAEMLKANMVRPTPKEILDLFWS